MKELAKLNETENKPKNVEEAIVAGWKTAEEMYTTAGVCRDTFNQFLLDVRNAISQKSNSGCDIDVTANLVVKLGSSHKAYYHPKVEEAFQAWLMKNQANQGRASATIKEATTQAVEKSEQNYIYSAKDIWELSNVSSRTWDNFVAEFLIATDCDQKRDYLEEHASRLVNSVDEDEKVRHNMATIKGNQEVWFLSESGIDKIYNCYDR